MKIAKCIAIHASWTVLLLLVVASIASADTITINISTPDAAPGGLSGFSGPYATVAVNLIDATDARVTFTMDTTANISFPMGSTSAANLNLNPGFTDQVLTFGTVAPGPNFRPVPFVTTFGTLNQPVGGFGNFNFQINLLGEYPDSAAVIDFTVTNLSGTWASAADVFTPNANGHLAAIRGFACANPCDATVPALSSGFAGDGPAPPPIPEPAGMTLLGMFLLAGWRALPRKG